MVDVRVLDAMMSSDFYAINMALRGQSTLDCNCGPHLDLEGWRSRREVAVAASLAFYILHTDGQLGLMAGARAYRGCWFTNTQLTTFRHDGYIWDKGYSFATPMRDEALFHLDEDMKLEKRVFPDAEDPVVPVLLDITVGKTSLYIPGPDEDDPSTIRGNGDFVGTLGIGQYILEYHSMLKIASIATGDDLTTITCAHTF